MYVAIQRNGKRVYFRKTTFSYSIQYKYECTTVQPLGASSESTKPSPVPVAARLVPVKNISKYICMYTFRAFLAIYSTRP